MNGTSIHYASTVTSTNLFTSSQPYLDIPKRYTATCRSHLFSDNHLSISFYEPPVWQFPFIDMYDDPLAVRYKSVNPMGTHLVDFNIALGDLVKQVTTRSAAWTQ